MCIFIALRWLFLCYICVYEHASNLIFFGRSCNFVSQCNNAVIYAAVNISFVVFLLTLVLVVSNFSNKNEVKST